MIPYLYLRFPVNLYYALIRGGLLPAYNSFIPLVKVTCTFVLSPNKGRAVFCKQLFHNFILDFLLIFVMPL